MMWVAIILGLIILVFVVVKFLSKRSSQDEVAGTSEKSCKNCGSEIPNDYTRSLCPHCKNFLM